MRRNMLRSKALIVLLIGAIWLASPRTATARIAPTKGDFEGIYWQDRWGVGRFAHFIVDPSLRTKLASFEGSYIRVDVTRGDQPMRPGPAFMQEIAKVTPLPKLPVELYLRTLPTHPAIGEPFQIVCELHNTGEAELAFGGVGLRAGLYTARTGRGEPPRVPSYSLQTFTRARLSNYGRSIDTDGRLVGTFGRSDNDQISCGGAVIGPGDKTPRVVLLPQGLDAGEYEIVVHADLYKGGFKRKDHLLLARHVIDIVDPAWKPARPKPLLRVTGLKIGKSDQYGRHVEVRIASAEGSRCRVVQNNDGEVRWAAFLKAFDERCRPIRLRVSSATLTKWKLSSLDEAGTDMQLDFDTKSRFEEGPIKRLELSLLTDHGLQRVVVTDDYEDAHWQTPPPFGPPAQGVQLRVRRARIPRGAGNRLQFFAQAINLSGRPVAWRRPSIPFGENIRIEIDGRRIALPENEAKHIFGWLDPRTTRQPEEWVVTLPKSVKLPSGQHTLRYVIDGQGGSYHGDGRTVPLLDGSLASNLLSFEIE